MSKFGHLKKLNPAADVVRPYTVYQIETEPTLFMKQATDSNKPYWNQLLRRNTAITRRLRGQQLNATILEQTRDSDRENMAKNCMTGWEKVIDDDGNEVKFTKEDCLDFFKELPNHIFDDIRNFASDAQNFIDEEIPDEEAASGN